MTTFSDIVNKYKKKKEESLSKFNFIKQTTPEQRGQLAIEEAQKREEIALNESVRRANSMAEQQNRMAYDNPENYRDVSVLGSEADKYREVTPIPMRREDIEEEPEEKSNMLQEFIASNRGYSDEELKKELFTRKPFKESAKEGAVGGAKFLGEMANIPINIGGFLAAKAAKLGGPEYYKKTLEGIGQYQEKSEELLKPKTSGEALSMKGLDVASLVTGTTKGVVDDLVKASNKVAAKNTAKKYGIKLSDDISEQVAKTKDPKIISNLINQAGKESSLISEARKYKSADEFVKAQGTPEKRLTFLRDIGNAQTRSDRNWIIRKADELTSYRDSEGVLRSNRMEGVEMEKQLLKEATEDKKIAMNNFYNSLEPKYRIGDVVEVESKGLMKKAKIEITGAEFNVQQSADQMKETGFPASFSFDALIGQNIKTGETVRIYKDYNVNGKPLLGTIKVKPEDVLEEFISRQKKTKLAEPQTDIWNKSQPLQEGASGNTLNEVIPNPEKKEALINFYKEVDGLSDISARKKASQYKVPESISNNQIKELGESFAKGYEDVTNKIDNKISKSVQKLSSEKRNLKDALVNWRRNTLVSKEMAQAKYVEFKGKISKKIDNFETIKKHQKGDSYSERGIIQEEFDRIHKKAEENLVKLGYRKNYIPQVYKNSQEEVIEAVSKYMKDNGVSDHTIDAYLSGEELQEATARGLKMNPFFSHQRVFPDYETAIKYGLKARFSKPSQLIAYANQELDNVISNKKLINELLNKGELSISRKPGYEFVRIPYDDFGYFAKPKTASKINDIFRSEEMLTAPQKFTKYTAQFSKFMQELILSAGVPKTNLNFFTFGYVVKDLTTGLGNLVRLKPKQAFTNFKTIRDLVRSNFTGWQIKALDKKQSTLIKMAQEGIDIGSRMGNFNQTNLGIRNFFKESKGARAIFGEGWDRVMQDKTFKGFLPSRSVTVFEDTYKTAIKKGLNESKASKLAGDVTKNYMGLTETVRGKSTDDLLSAVFFAPRFRESLINVYWNSAKSMLPIWKENGKFIAPIFKKEYSQNRALVTGMVVSYGLYDALNYQINGHHIWENPTGKEFELMIPINENGKLGKRKGDIMYIPFMPSQLAFFRNAASGSIAMAKGDFSTATQKIGANLSIPIKLGSELFSNKDYFGRDIYDKSLPPKEQVKQIAEYVGLSYNHPWIKGIWEQIKHKTASESPVYDKYVKISNLENEGKREEAKNIIDGFTDKDKDEYYKLKGMKLKPLYQTLSEAFELPLKFSSRGKISSAKYYEDLESFEKDVKAMPNGEEKTNKIQEYIMGLPEGDRQGRLFTLRELDIDTEGVTTSESVYKGRPIYNEIRKLKDEGKEKEAMEKYNSLSEEELGYYKSAKQSYGQSANAEEERQAKEQGIKVLSEEEKAKEYYKQYEGMSIKDKYQSLQELRKTNLPEYIEQEKLLAQEIVDTYYSKPKEERQSIQELIGEEAYQDTKLSTKVKGLRNLHLMTNEEKDIANMDVRSGERALYIYKRGLEMNEDDLKEFKKNLSKKGIATDTIISQYKWLEQHPEEAGRFEQQDFSQKTEILDKVESQIKEESPGVLEKLKNFIIKGASAAETSKPKELGTYTGSAECVGFARTINENLPYGLYTIYDKIDALNKSKDKYTPKKGGVAIIDTGDSTGHVAAVASINDNGTITIVEANWRKRRGTPLVTTRTGTPKELNVLGYFNS